MLRTRKELKTAVLDTTKQCPTTVNLEKGSSRFPETGCAQAREAIPPASEIRARRRAAFEGEERRRSGREASPPQSTATVTGGSSRTHPRCRDSTRATDPSQERSRAGCMQVRGQGFQPQRWMGRASLS